MLPRSCSNGRSAQCFGFEPRCKRFGSLAFYNWLPGVNPSWKYHHQRDKSLRMFRSNIFLLNIRQCTVTLKIQVICTLRYTGICTEDFLTAPLLQWTTNVCSVLDFGL